MRRSLVELSGLVKVYDQNGDSVSKNDKSCHICSMTQKGVFAKYEKYGTLSIYVQPFESRSSCSS